MPVGNIKNIAFTSVGGCKEECAKTEGCVAFSIGFKFLGGLRCWLKNKDHGAESASSGTSTARMSCYEGKAKLYCHLKYKT